MGVSFFYVKMAKFLVILTKMTSFWPFLFQKKWPCTFWVGWTKMRNMDFGVHRISQNYATFLEKVTPFFQFFKNERFWKNAQKWSHFFDTLKNTFFGHFLTTFFQFEDYSPWGPKKSRSKSGCSVGFGWATPYEMTLFWVKNGTPFLEGHFGEVEKWWNGWYYGNG